MSSKVPWFMDPQPINSEDFRIIHSFKGTTADAAWWYIQRWQRDFNASVGNHPSYFIIEKSRGCRHSHSYCGSRVSAIRTSFRNNSDIGVFCRITNSYGLVAPEDAPRRYLTNSLPVGPNNPLITTTIGGCNVVGRLCVGNTKGLLVPEMINDMELEHITNKLPDSVKVQKTEEQMSALGNIIACNDKFAIVHPDINKETEEQIADTLQVEVFRTMVGNNPLVGAYCVLNNKFGMVSPDVATTELEHLSDLLQVRLQVGTVNFGCKVIGSGLVMNDGSVYVGKKTSSFESKIMDSMLQ